MRPLQFLRRETLSLLPPSGGIEPDMVLQYQQIFPGLPVRCIVREENVSKPPDFFHPVIYADTHTTAENRSQDSRLGSGFDLCYSDIY